MLPAAIVLITVIFTLAFIISVYNSLVYLKNNVLQAFGNIDVLLKQRHDELGKLLETVKGYLSYEKDVLTQITQARSAFMQARTIGEKSEADNLMTATLKNLFAVAENYPDLKADTSFQHFRERISELENGISDRREFYNDAVTLFNTRIEMFPNSMIAGILQYKRFLLFAATKDERKDVTIKF